MRSPEGFAFLALRRSPEPGPREPKCGDLCENLSMGEAVWDCTSLSALGDFLEKSLSHWGKRAGGDQSPLHPSPRALSPSPVSPPLGTGDTLSSSSSSSLLSLLCVVRAPGRDLGRQRSRKQRAGAATAYTEEEGQGEDCVYVCVLFLFGGGGVGGRVLAGPALNSLDRATSPWPCSAS